jgi:POT family proton-dependent oligopeptide transporter
MNHERHPKGLYILFFTEMWERFGFYLMLGIFLLFLKDSQRGGLGWSHTEAAGLVGTYIALVYFTPFIGGLLADRLLGFRFTILIGGILMMLGYLFLAVPNTLVPNALYIALVLIIIGNGAFKPNISTLLGNLYPQGSKLKDAGYNIFYMGINIGAFACNFVAAIVRNYFDKYPIQVTEQWTIRGWQAAFATAGVGMFIGVMIFSLFYRRFAEADPDPRTKVGGSRESLWPLWLECVLPAVLFAAAGFLLANNGIRIKGWVEWTPFSAEFAKRFPLNAPTTAFLFSCLPVIVFYLRIWLKVPDRVDRGRVAALLTIFFVVIIFWALFHLNSTALVAFADESTNRQPNALVRLVTDNMEDFAEIAPPTYFFNAGPEVPRPNRESFKVVTAEQYEELKKANQLTPTKDQPLIVTEEMLDKVFTRTNANTPILPPGESIRLVNTELFASINPGFVIIFTPLVVAFFAWLRSRNLEPSTPAKIGLGLFLTGAGMVVMYFATVAAGYSREVVDGKVIEDIGDKVSALWLFGTYAIVTVGELCLSPMGLSLVSKMSPANIRSFMMGGWFLSTAFGNKLSGIFGELYAQMDRRWFWLMLAVGGALCAGVIFALLPWLKRQMATEAKK